MARTWARDAFGRPVPGRKRGWRKPHGPRLPETCLALDANRALCSPSLAEPQAEVTAYSSACLSDPRHHPIRSARIPRVRTNHQGVYPTIVFSNRAEDEEAIADLRSDDFELGELVTCQTEIDRKRIGS